MEELTAAQHLAIARHSDGPMWRIMWEPSLQTFLSSGVTGLCGEDPAILGGVAMFHGRPVTVIGTRKGRRWRKTSTAASVCRAPRATARPGG